MKALYKASTYFLTKRGFKLLEELQEDDYICYFVDGKLKTTKHFRVIKEDTTLYHFTLGKSNIFCSKNIANKLSITYSLSKTKVNNPILSFDVNRVKGYANLDLVLFYQYIFLNYFDIDISNNVLTFIRYNRPECYSINVANALCYVDDEVRDRRPDCFIPDFGYVFGNDCVFTSDVLATHLDKFFNQFIDSIDLYRFFLYELDVSKLFYVFNGVSYLNVSNYRMSQFILFLLGLGGYTGSMSVKDIFDFGRVDHKNYLISFSNVERPKIKQQSDTLKEQAVGIALPEEGTLITSTTCLVLGKKYTSVMFGPSYQEE